MLDHLLAHRVLVPSLLHSQVNMCLTPFCNPLLHLKLSDAILAGFSDFDESAFRLQNLSGEHTEMSIGSNRECHYSADPPKQQCQLCTIIDRPQTMDKLMLQHQMKRNQLCKLTSTFD